ncbi:LPD38 domain-containing protein [Comamonas sp. NoAH]|uniref:LPD38 domain-containing protein n=1 Tax=Comamonas halotolerans TaxID=3041496 RepID=UPI0024E123F7|nr:LPD38 domain-containing protein [Comamonas sp. NoAH]
MSTPNPFADPAFGLSKQPKNGKTGNGNPFADPEFGKQPLAPKRSLRAALNDTVIEAANSAAGTVSATFNFASPGNAASQWIDKNIIEAGEAAQSDVVKAEKARYAQEMQQAQGMGDEVSATLGYAARNPLLAAAQAAGSFAVPGLGVSKAKALAGIAGLGAKGASRAGLAAGAGLGAAAAGGDAAGTAYELSREGGATDEQAVAAARGASLIPAAIGAAGGLVGAERLVAGAKGFGGGVVSRALKTGAVEGVQEAIEEGVTQYEGQRAAVPFNPDLDPSKGVAGAATLGGVLGGTTGAGTSLLTRQNHSAARKPSEDLGLDPENGPLSKVAAAAVDEGRAAASVQTAPDTVKDELSLVPPTTSGQSSNAHPTPEQPINPQMEDAIGRDMEQRNAQLLESPLQDAQTPEVSEPTADTSYTQELPFTPLPLQNYGASTPIDDKPQTDSPLQAQGQASTPVTSQQVEGADGAQVHLDQSQTEEVPVTQPADSAAHSLAQNDPEASAFAAQSPQQSDVPVQAMSSPQASADQTQSRAFKDWYGDWQNAGHEASQADSTSNAAQDAAAGAVDVRRLQGSGDVGAAVDSRYAEVPIAGGTTNPDGAQGIAPEDRAALRVHDAAPGRGAASVGNTGGALALPGVQREAGLDTSTGVRAAHAGKVGQDATFTGTSGPTGPDGSPLRISQLTFSGSSGPTGVDGAPLPLYHGTREDITAFDLNHPTRKDHGWLGQGVYLASDPVTASEYAQRKMGKHGSSVMPVYANVRNPYVATQAQKDRIKAGGTAASQAFTERLKAMGHDGVVLDLGEAGIELVAFEPTQIKSTTGNNGDFDGFNPDIRYSLSAKVVTKPTAINLRRAMVQRTVNSLSKAWAQAPSIIIVDSMQDAQVPESVRAADALQRSQGAQGEPEGFWHEGKVYLVANALSSSADAARVLYHEVLGHHGLKGSFGPDLDKVLVQVAKMRPKDLEAKALGYGLDLNNPDHVTYAAEEVLAEMAQTRPDIGFVQRAIAAIRNFLRTHVPGFSTLELTDADIVQGYLLPARRWVEKGVLQGGKTVHNPPEHPKPAMSLSPMKSVEANIARGMESLAKAVTDKTTVHRAMHRNGLGWVDFVWGSEGQIKPSGRTKGAMGIAHILEARQRKDRLSEQEAIRYLGDVVKAVAQGGEFDRKEVAQSTRVGVAHENTIVWLTQNKGSNAWIVTGYEKTPSDAVAGRATTTSTHASASLTRKSMEGVESIVSDADVLGNTLFSRSHTGGAIRSSMGTLTPAQEAAWKNVAGLEKVPSLRERWDALKANLGLRMKQAMVDQFAPIAELDQHAYMMARMSKGSDGTLEAALLYGKPFLRDGVPDVDIKDGGFANVLASLKGEDYRFLTWVAAHRAELLKSQDRENLFSGGDISDLKTLNDGLMEDGSSRKEAYAKALMQLNSFNESVLRMAKESGLIDQDAYDLMRDQPYVPFYRLMEEEGGLQGPSFSKGLTNQEAWKRLSGGTEQLNADLLQNLLLNWGNLYAASARNRAALATMDAAEKMAVAYKVSSDTQGAAKVMREGVTEYWMVEDPYLMEAISALHYQASPLMKPLAKAKQLLTLGVTVNPTFKIRNLIRDVVSSMAIADLGFNPAANVAKGWKLTASDSQIYASMLASGGVIKFGTQEQTDRARKQAAKLSGVMLDQSGAQKLWRQMRELYDVYAEFGDRAENVNRAALYDRLIAKGHSHAEASFMARDLMDFSMGGSAPVVRFLTQSVPFLNARLQGLYKLGRAANDDPRRFATVALAVSMASLGLLAAYADDEDWKRREDWDRDSYWWFKIGETAYRIPKPFEVGAIGTLAERTAEAMFSEEMGSQRYMERIAHMVSQTFALDPIPQAVKPLLDIYANKDSFTGRAIESLADQRLRPKDRLNERTSEVARLLGQLGLPDPAQLVKGEYTELSPKQIDHLLRGYFSWIATAATTVSDYPLRMAADRGVRPEMRLKDMFLAGNFVESLPTGSSRYVKALYEQSRQVEQAYASYRDALASGNSRKATEVMESDGDWIRRRASVVQATKQLSQWNALAKRIEADNNLDAVQKRKQLTAIEQRRHEIAQLAVSRVAISGG